MAVLKRWEIGEEKLELEEEKWKKYVNWQVRYCQRKEAFERTNSMTTMKFYWELMENWWEKIEPHIYMKLNKHR